MLTKVQRELIRSQIKYSNRNAVLQPFWRTKTITIVFLFLFFCATLNEQFYGRTFMEQLQLLQRLTDFCLIPCFLGTAFQFK